MFISRGFQNLRQDCVDRYLDYGIDFSSGVTIINKFITSLFKINFNYVAGLIQEIMP